jgi:hypothetical protein
MKSEKKNNSFFIIAILILLAVVLGVVLALGKTLPADKVARAAAISDNLVEISDQPTMIVLVPKGTSLTRGMIFYPGARVDPLAYVPLLKPLAETGILVVIPKMPLGFAVLDINRAGKIQDAYPQVTCWVIGGHSLGGSMAAEYSADHPERIQGIVFVASYPGKKTSLNGYDIQGLAISGSQDGLATTEKVAAVVDNFPQGTKFIVLDGANHAQFGHYGEQVGDNPASISPVAQQEAATKAILEFINTLGGACTGEEGS